MKKLFLCSLGLLVLGLTACTQQPTVDEVVMETAKAMGGADKLDSITDQVSDWTFTMHQLPPGGENMEPQAGGAASPMSMPMRITYKRPNKIRFDFLGPDGQSFQSSCYDGVTGWSMQAGQKIDKTDIELQQDAEMAATWIDGFLHYQDKGMQLELLPNEVMDGKEYIVLKATGKSGQPMTYHIDAETHQIARQSGDMINFEGKLEPMYMTMSDYKMVDGIALAEYVAQYKADGEMLWEASFKSAQHNIGVEDAVFMPDNMMSAK